MFKVQILTICLLIVIILTLSISHIVRIFFPQTCALMLIQPIMGTSKMFWEVKAAGMILTTSSMKCHFVYKNIWLASYTQYTSRHGKEPFPFLFYRSEKDLYFVIDIENMPFVSFLMCIEKRFFPLLSFRHGKESFSSLFNKHGKE